MDLVTAKKENQIKDIGYVDNHPIQVFLGGYLIIKQFSVFERYFSSIKGDVRLLIQQKTRIVDQYILSEILATKYLKLTDESNNDEQNQTVKKLRIFQHVAIFDQIYIKTMYNQLVNNDQMEQLLKTSGSIQGGLWGLKLQVNGHIKNRAVRLQLNFEVSKEQSILKDTIRKLKQKIVRLYNQGDWKELFNQATYVDFRVAIGGVFVQNFYQKVTFQPSLIYELVSIFTNKSLVEIDLLFFLSEQVYMQQVIYPNIQQILRDRNILTKKNIEMHPKWIDFILQPKQDGIRALLISRNGTVSFLFESALEVVMQNVEIPSFVLEVEVTGTQVYLYDLHYNEMTLYQQSMIQRLYSISTLLTILQNKLHDKQQYNFNSTPFILITKELALDQYKLQSAFNQIISQSINNQGIVLYSNQSYLNQKIYKWIPSEKISIDFFCQIVPYELLDKPKDPEFLYIGLFCQISTKDIEISNIQHYIEADFNCQNKLIIFQSPSLHSPAFIKRSIKEEQEDPINNKVVEFTINYYTQQWNIYRVRNDKDPSQKNFGNYYTKALQILNSIVDPIQFQSLFSSDMNLVIRKVFLYDSMFRFFDIVKQTTINTIQVQKNVKSVMDLGIGLGFDINLYVQSDIKKLVCIDIQEFNVQQSQKRFQQILASQDTPIIFCAKQIDLTKKHSSVQLLEIAQEYDVQFVNCNIAIDEFISNTSIFDVFFKQLGNNRPVIAQFLFFNGRKIFDLLSKTEDIQIFEQKTLKYQYQRAYKSTTLLDIGLNILIKPIVRNTLIEHMIFNPDYLEHLMIKNGYQCILKYDLGGSVQQGGLFTEDQLQLFQLQFKALNQQDQFHSSLFSIYVFEKGK